MPQPDVTAPTRISRPATGGARWVLLLFAAPLLGLLVVPLLALVFHLTPSLIVNSLQQSATLQAVILSLETSSAAVILTVIFGTPLAYLLARSRFRGRTLVEVFVDLPTVLPPAVAGIALLLAFGRRGFFGAYLDRIGIDIPFTPMAVVLAQTFVAAPYYVKATTIGLAAVSSDLLEASSLDGASPTQAFNLVTLPLALRGIVGGAALCWARALGEFGATIIFAGNLPGRTQTMPLAIYIGFQIDLDQALSLGAILLFLSFSLLLTIRVLLRPTNAIS